jgi:hypothetical protein
MRTISQTIIEPTLGFPFESGNFAMTNATTGTVFLQNQQTGMDEWEEDEDSEDGDEDTIIEVEIDPDLEDDDEDERFDNDGEDEELSDDEDDDEFEQYLFGEEDE